MIDLARLEAVVLARLSIGGARPLTPAGLSRALEPFLHRALTNPEARQKLAETIDRLRESGHVDRRKLTLTDAGAARLSAALGVPVVPKARNWGDFKRKHLLRLLEKDAGASDPSTLGLRLIARKLGLPARSARSEAALANAWLARALGLEGESSSPFRMRTAALATSLNVPARPRLEDVVRISVKAISGARTAGPGDVVQAMVAHWLTETAPQNTASDAKPTQSHEDLLARAVQKVHRAIQGGTVRRFGQNKVFIASVWERLQSDPELLAVGEAGFKDLLVAAHQRGALTLARADLVAAMDPADVAASETRHLNATYHFIQDSGERP